MHGTNELHVTKITLGVEHANMMG